MNKLNGHETFVTEKFSVCIVLFKERKLTNNYISTKSITYINIHIYK